MREDPAPRDSVQTAVFEAPTSEKSPALWKRTLGIVGGMFLGAIFLVAAWAKALDTSSFAAQITSEGLDFLLPAGAVALFALALEVALGSALMLWVRRWWILWPTAALVVFFLFLTGRSYWRYTQGIEPEDAGCGCFGNLVQRTPAEAFWQDVLLMVPALLLAFLARDLFKALPRVRLIAVGFLTGAVVLLGWKAPDLPLDDLATRLKPGADPMTWCAGGGDGPRTCMDSVLPELAQGEHVVVLVDINDREFGGHVESLNEYTWAGRGPSLWVLSGNTEEELFSFRFSSGPAFELREAPSPLLRPLYRTLPRSFLVRDGRVVETFRGLPPLQELAGASDEVQAAGQP